MGNDQFEPTYSYLGIDMQGRGALKFTERSVLSLNTYYYKREESRKAPHKIPVITSKFFSRVTTSQYKDACVFKAFTHLDSSLHHRFLQCHTGVIVCVLLLAPRSPHTKYETSQLLSVSYIELQAM